MENQPRYLSANDTQRIRESVERGVEKVVKPFIRRVERQSRVRIKPGIHIGGFGDPCRNHENMFGRQINIF